MTISIKRITMSPSRIAEADVLRVKASSNPASLGSAIAHQIYADKPVVLRAIGAGAVNQAVKAITIARGFVAARGINLYDCPGFTTVEMPEGPVTAMTFRMIVGEL
jgi:stage V sporulation protein S